MSSYYFITGVLFLITVALVSTGQAERSDPSNQHNQTNVKLQARILLETNNLDIDEKLSTPLPIEKASSTTELQQVSSTTLASSTANIAAPPSNGKRKRGKPKAARSEGSLSNIWSMFLPGSSAANSEPIDYEENLESEESGNEVSQQNKSGENVTNSTLSPPEVGNSLQRRQEQVVVVENNDERLVAKYSRPPRQDGMSSAEAMTTTTTSTTTMKPTLHLSQVSQVSRATNSSSALTPTVDLIIEASTSASRQDLQPVQLITGALSKDIGAMPPNMNDIVSNIMGSMSWQNANEALNVNRSSPSVVNENNNLSAEGGEREEDEKQTSTRTQSNGGKNSNFERWLNRIQFQEPPVSTSTASSQSQPPTTELRTPTPTPLLNRLARPSRVPEVANATTSESRTSSPIANIRWPQATRQTTNYSTQPFDTSSESVRMTEPFLEARLRQQVGVQQQQQQQQQLLHQLPPSRSTKIQFLEGVKGASGAVPTTNQRIMAMTAQNQRSQFMDQQNLIGVQQHHNRFQHPFQQHLRQQQSQLIHGIKQPAAQASTISVSTQDGTSNTSLSFAPNLSSLMNSLNNEMSQVVNSTPSSGGRNSDEQSGIDSNMFQSQDEILRQVTSAINFEQQFNHKRSDVHNHRKPGETSAAHAAPLDSNDIESPDSISKMFKVGSSLSELIEMSTTSAPSSSSTSTSTGIAADLVNERLRQNNNNSSQSVLGVEDIDKNFDMLAERLRALAQQQQQVTSATNGSNQPSWLRRPEMTLSTSDLTSNNLTRLAATLAASTGNNASSTVGSGPASNQQPSISLELVRELLNKHERSKNELRSSQEAVGLLMQQLMQMNQSSEANNNNHSNANGNRLDKQSSHQIQQRQNSQGQSQQAAAVQQVPGNADHSESNANNAATQQDKPPPGVSNIGWTPVVPSSGLNPPPSPANQLKNRLRQQPMKVSQADNAGIGKDLANDDFYMNNLAFMFASSQQANPEEDLQTNQRIIGLPIAILKEEEDLTDAVPQSQLEAMAEQLSGQNNRHMLHSNQQQQFSPRLAVQNPPQQQHQFDQPQNHLSQVQQIVQGYSPQTFAPVPRSPQFNQHVMANMARNQALNAAPVEAVPHQSAFHQHPELASLVQENNQQDHNPYLNAFVNANNKIIEPKANLLSEPSPRDVADNPSPQQPPAQQPLQSPQQPHLSHLNTESIQSQGNLYGSQKAQELRNNIEHSLMMQHQPQIHHPHSNNQHQYQQSHNNIENIRPQVNEDFRLQRQSQHHQQQHVSPPPMHPNSQYMQSVINNYPRPPGLGGEITPHPHMRAQPPMITTTIANNGPPVRLREVSLYKPFGFRTHHSVAYQASPAMAAMFPGLSQPSGPSLLRHMTPFRAAYTEGQRLLRPLMPHQLADNLRQHTMNQYQSQSLLNSLPVPPQMRQPYSNYNQLKRHSAHEDRRSKAHMRYPSASRLEVQHIEPEEVDRDILMDDNFDHNNFEEIKFIPMDSANTPSIEDEELHLMHKHLPVSASEKKPGRPSGQLVKFRQQRARQFDTARQSKNLDELGQIRHCIQAPVKVDPTSSPKATTTTTTSSSELEEIPGKSSSTTISAVAKLPESTTLASSNTTTLDNTFTSTTTTSTITVPK